MSEYNFKRFIKTGAKLGNYTISVTKSNTFGFSSGFYNKENIKSFGKVVLYYDDVKKAVAFQFTNDAAAEGAFTIVHSKAGSTGSVTARSFFIDNKIDDKEFFGKKKPIQIEDEQIGKIYIANLLDNVH